MTSRTRDVLAQVDLIACEDTRVTQKLLNHIGLKKNTLSYREENERELARELADKISKGENIALFPTQGFQQSVTLVSD